ncbi:hypothetical protein BD311DRAFT_744979 [Dichomitus squalens]|uniref:Uncharacterized protein n=1 Tax=Dichomitus squalens TaxID=114155 RepID=A0A4Q9N5T6_9APHY|nr:hypothetical protein BD311DRAFT_744979 [Dichomitus squalens]
MYDVAFQYTSFFYITSMERFSLCNWVMYVGNEDYMKEYTFIYYNSGIGGFTGAFGLGYVTCVMSQRQRGRDGRECGWVGRIV